MILWPNFHAAPLIINLKNTLSSSYPLTQVKVHNAHPRECSEQSECRKTEWNILHHRTSLVSFENVNREWTADGEVEWKLGFINDRADEEAFFQSIKF